MPGSNAASPKAKTNTGSANAPALTRITEHTSAPRVAFSSRNHRATSSARINNTASSRITARVTRAISSMGPSACNSARKVNAGTKISRLVCASTSPFSRKRGCNNATLPETRNTGKTTLSRICIQSQSHEQGSGCSAASSSVKYASNNRFVKPDVATASTTLLPIPYQDLIFDR